MIKVPKVPPNNCNAVLQNFINLAEDVNVFNSLPFIKFDKTKNHKSTKEKKKVPNLPLNNKNTFVQKYN